jgi:hypothetical protein
VHTRDCVCLCACRCGVCAVGWEPFWRTLSRSWHVRSRLSSGLVLAYLMKRPRGCDIAQVNVTLLALGFETNSSEIHALFPALGAAPSQAPSCTVLPHRPPCLMLPKSCEEPSCPPRAGQRPPKTLGLPGSQAVPRVPSSFVCP